MPTTVSFALAARPPRPLPELSMSNPARGYATSGWVPATLLGIATAAILVRFGVPVIEVAGFTAYAVAGLAVPGLLWVRLLRRGSTHIAEDLALGLALGYCVE